MKKIDTIVYTTELGKTSYISDAKNDGVDCICALDARSAVYMATGISAQQKKPVIVCVKGTNESRSAFAGMTEAYYRDLPVVLVTFGCNLDYSNELADTVYGHYIVKDTTEIVTLLSNKKPLHIEINTIIPQDHKEDCSKLSELFKGILDKNDFLYISQQIQINGSFQCKVITGGMPGCAEGAVANVVGASLSKIRKRYIGILTEEELKHDINTIGNVNINDSLFFVVICDGKNKMISDYAESLGYNVFDSTEGELSKEALSAIVRNESRSLLMVYREVKQ